MEKYVFSGSLTQEMHDLLMSNPKFEPLDALVTQLDRSSIRQMIEWKREGFIRWLFIDSGAFSVHTGKAKTTVEEYTEFLNSIDDDFDVCAQLDTIPGKLGQPKKPEDYVISAEKSWENFIQMRKMVKSPNKVMPVFHFGEDIKYLKRMLEFKDEKGNPIQYIGLSPANDASIEDRSIYLRDMFNYIHHSANPNVKTHIYGFTSLEAMSKYPCYSADSITHRLLAGYGKLISRNYKIVSISLKVRNNKAKSSMSIVDAADEFTMKKFLEEVEDFGFTLEQLQNSVSARVAFNILSIQLLVKTKYKYHQDNLVRPKKFFKIEMR